MSDQVETKQVRWQDLEVAKEPVVIDWREQELPRGFLMLTGITAKEFDEAVTKNFPDGLQASGEFYTEIPVYGNGRAFQAPASQHEKLAKLARMYGGIEFGVAPSICTPSRNPLTLAEYERELNNAE